MYCNDHGYYIYIISQLKCLLPVPPKTIQITTEPRSVVEGLKATIICKVAKIKPFEGLDLQILNGSLQLDDNGRQDQPKRNSDKETYSVTKTFEVTFTRYVTIFEAYNVINQK